MNNPNYCSAECYTRYRRLMVAKGLIVAGANLRTIMAQAPADYFPELSSGIDTDGSINNLGSGGGGGSSDHGTLTGLADDDHTQYLLASGSRAMSGALQMDANDIDAAATIALTEDIEFTERADHASTPAAGKGYVWVKSDAPSALIYTDDAGTDLNLSAKEAQHRHQFRFHEGAATFATAQEETIFNSRKALTITAVHVATTRSGGTGTSTSTSYWRVRVYNGGSASGSLVATYQSHDGVSTADDMADQFDVKKPSVSNTSVSADTDITVEVWAETSGGAPVSMNTEAITVDVYTTGD